MGLKLTFLWRNRDTGEDNPISEDVILKKSSVTQNTLTIQKSHPFLTHSVGSPYTIVLAALLQRYDKELELGTQAAIRDWINSTLKGEAGFTELVSNYLLPSCINVKIRIRSLVHMWKLQPDSLLTREAKSKSKALFLSQTSLETKSAGIHGRKIKYSLRN